MNRRDAAIMALGDSVKIESNGRDVYRRAAEKAENTLATSVFRALADDGKDPLRRVREIWEQLKTLRSVPGQREGWWLTLP